MKLHLGCGNDYKEGYVNVDLYPQPDYKIDEVWDIRSIPQPDNSVDEILSSHVIEHFDFKTGQEVLSEWYRVLKPNGILKLETPDLLSNCQEFVTADDQRRIYLYNNFFSNADLKPGQAHLFLYTEQQLCGFLYHLKFKTINRVQPWSQYSVDPKNKHLFLAIEAQK